MLIMTHPLPGSPSPVNTATNLSTLKDTTPAKIANVLDLIVGDSAPTTNDTPATDRVEIPLPDKFNQRKDELLGMLGGNYQFGGGNWDLDSVMDPSSAGGAGTDFAYELTKNIEQNNPAWLASAKAMLEQASQQPQRVLQLLQ